MMTFNELTGENTFTSLSIPHISHIMRVVAVKYVSGVDDQSNAGRVPLADRDDEIIAFIETVMVFFLCLIAQ